MNDSVCYLTKLREKFLILERAVIIAREAHALQSFAVTWGSVKIMIRITFA